ncbi:MAG TPA: hypothetical protein VIV40_10775 [Kofleriaceae bacterium]
MRVALSALACACVKIPDFQPRDGGGDTSDAMTDGGMQGPLVSVVPNGTNNMGALATAPGYEMVFADNGAHFPYQLNLLANPKQLILGGSQECADEHGMGIALYPVTRINGEPNVDYGTSTLSIPLSGPYVGQVRLQWSVGYACPSSTSGAISGHTTFSFFPDGRLTRFDVVNNSAARNAADCTACGTTSSQFYVTSYNTLIVDGNASLSDGTQAGLASYGAEVAPLGSACIRERGYSLAFSWVDTRTRMRVAAAGPPARTIAFIKDMYNGATLPVDGWFSTTQMGISTEACGTLESRIAEFSADDHQLRINSNPLGAALEDGIYGGDPQTGGYPIDYPVTLEPAGALPRIPAGFAVWLHSTPTPNPLRVTHSAGHTGNWYYEQHPDANSVVFWFNVPLEQGETITINES